MPRENLENDVLKNDVRHLLDLLVDGELSPKARRELLLRLDDEAGGWRRCAMAFLEAQAWRESLRASETATSQNAASISQGKPGYPLGAGQDGWRSAIGGALAMAMCLAVAFGLGLLTAHISLRQSSPSAPQVAQHALSALGSAPDKRQQAPPSPEAGQRQTLAENVTLLTGGPGDEDASMQVPIFSLQDVDAWAKTHSTASRDWIDSLRASGHEVRHQRYWAPLRLTDGREVMLPIEQLDVTPVRRVYQ